MSRRRRQALSPTLFPFLAVLVCTLGTLILLLALVAENATTVAAAETQRAQTPPPVDRLTAESVDLLIEEAEFRLQHLIAIRDAQVADLENRRDQLAHLDDHAQRLKQELQRLVDEAKMATGRKEAKQVDQRRLDALKQQIAVESERIEQLRAERENQTPRVVIVPHKGPNGTDRRPVYLECTSAGLTIWPEGVELSEVLLEDSSANANPLDAALRVIRHHAMQNYGDPVAPYPLLIVRPDGIDTYAAARFAMQDWDDQFGYELVPANVELAYDVPDPELKDRIDYAIRQAAIKQRGRQRIAAAASGSGGVSASKSYPTLSAASMDRHGRASGYRNHRDGYATSNPYAYSPGNPAGASNAGTGADAARRLDRQLREAAGDPNIAHSFNDGFGGNPVAGESSVGVMGMPGEEGTAIAELSGAGETTGGGRGSAAGPASSQSAEVNPYASKTGGETTGETTGEKDVNQLSGSDQHAIGERATSDHPPGSEATAAEQSAAAKSQASPSDAQRNAPRVVGSGASATPPPQGATAGPALPTTSTAPPMTMPDPPPEAANMAEMVRRQGNDWALPRSVAQSHGTAIVRTIQVQCYPDRFVLLPDRGASGVEMFGVTDGDINRATLQLATAIRDRIVRWGAALPGGRWQPRLVVEIMPRGDSRFHQLRTLMSGSGVEIEGRQSR